MASLLGRLARGAARVAGKVAAPAARVLGKTALKSLPIVGTGIALYEGAQALGGVFRGAGGPQALPALPALPASVMPMAASGGGQMMTAADAFTLQSMASGRKASIAMPELNVDQLNAMQAAGLMTQFSELRTYRRSPRKDQVVVHPVTRDGQVMTFALNKRIARAWGLWKPASKPPISAGEMNAIRKANAVVKKFTRIGKEIRSVANFGSRRGPPRLQVLEAPGRKVIGRKAA